MALGSIPAPSRYLATPLTSPFTASAAPTAFDQLADGIDTNALLVFASALADLCYEVGDGAAYVDHQVGQSHERHHQVKEVGVVVEVAVGHVSLVVQVGGEDARILKDGAVLYNGAVTASVSSGILALLSGI